MSRQLIDALIILSVLVLGATHLAAQGFSRKLVRATPASVAIASSPRGEKIAASPRLPHSTSGDQ